MNRLSNKYRTKTTVLIQHKTIRYFEFMIIAGQKLTILFHTEFQNWHWSCQWHPAKFFPLRWKEYFEWWAETTVGPLCGRALLIVELQYTYIVRYSLFLYLFSFSFSISCFHGILDERTRGYFSKDKVYWSCNILYTAGKPNK